MPCGVVECDKATAGDAEQMKFVELEIIRERIEVARNASGLRPCCGIGRALAPAAAIERDDAISGLRKARDLIGPDSTGAGIGVEQHDRRTRAAAIGEP